LPEVNPEETMAKKWYVAHTYSGHENKAKKYLESAAEAEGLAEMIGRILVPTEEIVEMKQGQRHTSVRPLPESPISWERPENRRR
jgi:transcriptional antiterminator NusG